MNTATSIYEYAKGALQVSADRPAIWFFDKPMTYTELFERIDNFADHLYGLGVREGTVVTIHLPNCPQAVIAIYAVAKLGGICNMVHPQMPEEALKRCVAFTDSEYLISYNRGILACGMAVKKIYVDMMSYLSGLVDVGVPDSSMISFNTLVQPYMTAVQIPEQSSLSETCAMYMHSTGTTGLPKCVMLSHKAINAWVEHMKAHSYGIALNEMVFLVVVPLFHSLGFAGNVHPAIAFGAQTVIFPKWDCQAAVEAIRKHRVTYISNVPSLYRDLLRNPNFSGEDISSLTHCMVGGEVVPPELILELDARIGNGRVARTCLGCTETSGAYCGLYLPEHKTDASGYALSGARVMVLAADGQIKPVGEGELLATNESLMIGYLKEPEATAEAILNYDGCRWLKTGDYGRIEEDGAVYFISRIKEIIVRKGQNVFPREVEAVISAVEDVAEVCVLGIPDEQNATETVCAVVVLKPGKPQETAKENILLECGNVLPRYSIPGRIEFRTFIPRNQLGKVDRKALKDQL